MTESILRFVFAPRSDDKGRANARNTRVHDHQNSREQQGRTIDDADIVARVRAGDDAAVAQLFREYAPGLVTFAATYVRSDDLAWDVVQDVFLWLVAHRTTWAVPTTVRAYLYSAARHRVLNVLKHDAVERRWSARAWEESAMQAMTSSMAQSGDAAMLRDERHRALIAAVAQLTETRRTALALRYGHAMSYAEIAGVLSSSVKAVENQLNRTLRQLREILEPDR